MRVDRKSAWFLLVIVLLSAALPGLACLAPAHHSACCQEMMQDCGSSMTMPDSCCKMRSTDPNLPPALALHPENTGLSSQVFVASILMPPANVIALVTSAETPPSSPASSRSSILRI